MEEMCDLLRSNPTITVSQAVGQYDDSKQEVLYEALRESQNESCDTPTGPDLAGMALAEEIPKSKLKLPTQLEKFNIKPRLAKPAP